MTLKVTPIRYVCFYYVGPNSKKGKRFFLLLCLHLHFHTFQTRSIYHYVS